MQTKFKSSRKIAGIALLAIAAATFSANIAPANAQNYNSGYNNNSQIGVSIDGRMIDVGSVAPVQANNRVLVPLRGVLESLGATVAYDANTGSVLAQRGNTQISLRIGSDQALVNGRNRVLDVPAQTLYGRTLVPLRFVAESLGANVSWDSAQRVVFIATNGNAPGNGGGNNGNFPPPTPPRFTTVNGTVTRNLPGNRAFEILTDRGARLRVQSRINEPAGISVDDRVQLRGTLQGNIFRAETIRLTSDAEREVTVQGTVLDVISSTRLRLRTDNNRTLTVTSNQTLPGRLNAGDRVRAVGTQTGNNVETQRVTLLSNIN